MLSGHDQCSHRQISTGRSMQLITYISAGLCHKWRIGPVASHLPLRKNLLLVLLLQCHKVCPVCSSFLCSESTCEATMVVLDCHVTIEPDSTEPSLDLARACRLDIVSFSSLSRHRR